MATALYQNPKKPEKKSRIFLFTTERGSAGAVSVEPLLGLLEWLWQRALSQAVPYPGKVLSPDVSGFVRMEQKNSGYNLYLMNPLRRQVPFTRRYRKRKREWSGVRVPPRGAGRSAGHFDESRSGSGSVVRMQGHPTRRQVICEG